MAQLKRETSIGGIDILDFFYPIGTIYETMDNTFDPNTEWGGTWEKIIDRFMYGASESGLTGGEETHKLTIDEMPSHSHPNSTTTAMNWDNNWGAGNSWSAYSNASYQYYQPLSIKAQGGGNHTTTCLRILQSIFGRELLKYFKVSLFNNF